MLTTKTQYKYVSFPTLTVVDGTIIPARSVRGDTVFPLRAGDVAFIHESMMRKCDRRGTSIRLIAPTTLTDGRTALLRAMEWCIRSCGCYYNGDAPFAPLEFMSGSYGVGRYIKPTGFNVRESSLMRFNRTEWMRPYSSGGSGGFQQLTTNFNEYYKALYENAKAPALNFIIDLYRELESFHRMMIWAENRWKGFFTIGEGYYSMYTEGGSRGGVDQEETTECDIRGVDDIYYSSFGGGVYGRLIYAQSAPPLTFDFDLHNVSANDIFGVLVWECERGKHTLSPDSGDLDETVEVCKVVKLTRSGNNVIVPAQYLHSNYIRDSILSGFLGWRIPDRKDEDEYSVSGTFLGIHSMIVDFAPPVDGGVEVSSTGWK